MASAGFTQKLYKATVANPPDPLKEHCFECLKHRNCSWKDATRALKIASGPDKHSLVHRCASTRLCNEYCSGPRLPEFYVGGISRARRPITRPIQTVLYRPGEIKDGICGVDFNSVEAAESFRVGLGGLLGTSEFLACYHRPCLFWEGHGFARNSPCLYGAVKVRECGRSSAPDDLVLRVYGPVPSAGSVRVCACNRLVQDCVEGRFRAGLRQGRRCMELCSRDALCSYASARASVQSCGSTRSAYWSAALPLHGMQMPTCVTVLFIMFERVRNQKPLL